MGGASITVHGIFLGTLKCEKYYLHTYHTFEELKRDIEAYIRFYNNE
ncbi:IS3 family transposase [Paenibacillus sp. V4I9]